jgi:diguanylate cyclase (GGDEF)-like protein
MASRSLAYPACRRSERVAIAFPVEILGTDLYGNHFSDRTRTTTVSRYGCCLPLRRLLQADQAIQIRRIGTDEIVAGRVVAPMGSQTGVRLYGVGTQESCESLWGIRFSAGFHETLREAEYYLHRNEGHRISLNMRVVPLLNREGGIVSAVQVFSDAANRRGEKRVRELEQLAYRDALTSLPNRRYLELKVEQGLEEHRRFGRLFGLLMFDVDRFKPVNDTHGHQAGDALLKAMAETLEQGLRTVDIVGRWGGDEFLVLMPDLDAIELGDLAERCRVLVAQSSVATGQSQASVTASIGATVLSHVDSATASIRRADELMYQSKRSGGDRTTAG